MRRLRMPGHSEATQADANPRNLGSSLVVQRPTLRPLMRSQTNGHASARPSIHPVDQATWPSAAPRPHAAVDVMVVLRPWAPSP
jgi:hypothetical protein